MKQDWITKTLGETCEIYQPKTITGKDMVDNGPYPVFGANGIIGRYDKYNHEAPQLLITCRGATCGTVNISDPFSWITGNAMVVRPKDSSIDLRFLEYAFRNGIEIHKAITGAAQPQITRANLSPLTITYPTSLEEQRRIVDLVSRADGIVQLRREAEKKAAELIPALFFDMFGDLATNPKGWPIATVGDALESADYGSSTKASSNGLGLPFIRMGNVTYAGNLNLSDMKFVELPPAEVERYGLREGDILFNRTNSKELVGKTGLWDGSCEAVVASYFIRLRVRRDIATPSYLWAFMNSAYMKRVLFDTARGAIGQSNINSRELKAFRFLLPPLELQKQFDARYRDISGLCIQQVAATIRSQAVFDALLASVFTRS